MDLKNFLIQECEYVSLSTNGQRLNLSVDKSTLSVNNNDCIPEVNFNLECPNDLCNRTAGSTVLASNTCYNCDNFSEEFENMKVAVEILQSKTDALQSLANV